jgi:hypothetical protein
MRRTKDNDNVDDDNDDDDHVARDGDDDDDETLDPFALFCAYHLGLTPEGQKRELNIHDVARLLSKVHGRFVDKDAVEEALIAHGLTAADLMNSDFDLAAAREDIWASPPGVDLRSLAAMHFEHWKNAVERPRDWAAELAVDEAENAKVFGGVGTAAPNRRQKP